MFMPKDHVAGTAVDHDGERWDAVQSRRRESRRRLRVRRALDRRLLPALVRGTPAPAPQRRVLRCARAARAAGYRACKRCDPDGSSTREKQVQAILAALPPDRAGGGAHVARDACAQGRTERVPLPPAVQGRHGRHAARLPPRAPDRAAERHAQGQPVGHRRDLRRRLQLRRALLRPRRRTARHDREQLSPRRRRRGDPLRGADLRARPRAGRRDRAAACARSSSATPWPNSRRACTNAFPRRSSARPTPSSAPGCSACSITCRRPLSPSSPQLDLPLDVRGTAFQQQVWKALREIPAGTTSTYTAVAEKIGRPSAVRAVAQAIASNPVAVAVPAIACCAATARSAATAGAWSARNSCWSTSSARPAQPKGPR